MVLNKKLVSEICSAIIAIYGRGGQMIVDVFNSQTDATTRTNMAEDMLAKVRLVYAHERAKMLAEWRKHNAQNLAKWEKAEADAISRWDSMKAGFANMDSSLPWSARKAGRDAAKEQVFAHSNSLCPPQVLAILKPSRNFEQTVSDCLDWEAQKAAAEAKGTGTEG